MDKKNMPEIHKGLAGVYVGATKISKVDGNEGVLSYRGKPIEELSEWEFEKVIFWLLKGKIASSTELLELKNFLYANQQLSDIELNILKSINVEIHPMKLLQGMLPLLDLKYVGQIDLLEHEELVGLLLLSKISSIIPAFHRLSLEKEILTAKEGLSFHENFLYKFTGKLPTKLEAKTLDVTQILQLEHGYNASTFSCIVTGSTLAPVEVAVSAAIGTLYGKLHGGADQAALEMAMKIGDVKNVENYVMTCLANKEKIMGMGHRVYRIVDPRAKILKPMAKELTALTPYENNYKILESVEKIMNREMAKKGKEIWANVEFYKGLVFQSLGIPTQYFTSLFAMARTIGYLAHFIEYREDNKLVRPKAYYIGQ